MRRALICLSKATVPQGAKAKKPPMGKWSHNKSQKPSQNQLARTLAFTKNENNALRRINKNIMNSRDVVTEWHETSNRWNKVNYMTALTTMSKNGEVVSQSSYNSFLLDFQSKLKAEGGKGWLSPQDVERVLYLLLKRPGITEIPQYFDKGGGKWLAQNSKSSVLFKILIHYSKHSVRPDNILKHMSEKDLHKRLSTVFETVDRSLIPRLSSVLEDWDANTHSSDTYAQLVYGRDECVAFLSPKNDAAKNADELLELYVWGREAMTVDVLGKLMYRLGEGKDKLGDAVELDERYEMAREDFRIQLTCLSNGVNSSGTRIDMKDRFKSGGISFLLRACSIHKLRAEGYKVCERLVRDGDDWFFGSYAMIEIINSLRGMAKLGLACYGEEDWVRVLLSRKEAKRDPEVMKLLKAMGASDKKLQSIRRGPAVGDAVADGEEKESSKETTDVVADDQIKHDSKDGEGSEEKTQ